MRNLPDGVPATFPQNQRTIGSSSLCPVASYCCFRTCLDESTSPLNLPNSHRLCWKLSRTDLVVDFVLFSESNALGSFGPDVTSRSAPPFSWRHRSLRFFLTSKLYSLFQSLYGMRIRSCQRQALRVGGNAVRITAENGAPKNGGAEREGHFLAERQAASTPRE